jgi:hypothetical protein
VVGDHGQLLAGGQGAVEPLQLAEGVAQFLLEGGPFAPLGEEDVDAHPTPAGSVPREAVEDRPPDEGERGARLE